MSIFSKSGGDFPSSVTKYTRGEYKLKLSPKIVIKENEDLEYFE